MSILRKLAFTFAIALLTGTAVADEKPKLIDTTPGKPPSDAVVLFDGKSTAAFLNTRGEACQWPVVDGAMVVKDGFIVSKLHFRDAQIHVEFAVPDIGETGGSAGNSGVYIHGQYEMQIFNCFAYEMEPKDTIGAVYRISTPLVNASRKPGEWQVYEIIFIAPRRDKDGKIVKPGSITALLNGVLVQYNAHFKESVSKWNPLVYRMTPYTDKIKESLKKTGTGPLFLQDHHSPVKFRNIWLRPLDDKAKLFSPESE